MDREVKVIREDDNEVSYCLFSSLRAGDTVFMYGKPVMLADDAHYSGDASYDGYLAYDEYADAIFPEECDID